MTFEAAFDLLHDFLYESSLEMGQNLETECRLTLEYLQCVKHVAFKFYGKTPQTGEEWYTFYEGLGRSLFDKIDSNNDGFVDKVGLVLVMGRERTPFSAFLR